jgi:outer membrane protein OmpA-like peptidoglycan-associated protein
MKLLFQTFIFAVFLLSETFAQVQWAEKVVAVSSEKKGKGKQYKAEQVLGKPNVLPSFGSSPCAWSPEVADNDKKEEFIHVSFAKPVAIRQVLVAENFNAGSISEIYAYDTQGKANLIYKNPAIRSEGKGRLFSLPIPQTPYQVASVKVVLRTDLVKGENQIDAIGISETDEAVVIRPNLVKNPTKYHPEMLGSEVNSPYSEANPVLRPNGKGMYFTRADHPENIKDTIDSKVLFKQDIWYSDIDEKGNFTKAISVGSPLNTRQHNASFTIADDESFMLLNNRYLPSGILEKGLSITYKTADGKWGKPVPVDIEGFVSKSEFSEFWLSKDGKVLIMSIEDDNSLGGNDLYVSFRKGENQFGKPINMGNVINSVGDEATPWLDEDGKTLYFSSNGFSGYGSFDIFVSKRLDDTWTNWSEPENLGAAINSPGMDLYFSKQGNFGYFSSKGDIYKVRLVEPVLVINGKTLNIKNREPVRANILIQEKDTPTQPTIESENGIFTLKLQLGKKYRITAEAKGFFPKEDEIDATQIADYLEQDKEILMTPLEKNQVIRLNFIYFARAESMLLPESYSELDKIAKMMQENPNVKIRLEGHTEIYGNKKALKKLSKERVISVKNYLVSKGVSKKRIDYKAFGAERPLSREDTEAARQLNRRVEIRVI